MCNYVRIPSKKNQIYLIKKALPYEIIKVFADQDSFERELYLYKMFSKKDIQYQIRSAQLIDFNPTKKTIRLTYLEGDTLLTALENAEKDEDLALAKQLIIELIGWLQSFDQLLQDNLTGTDLNKLGIDQEHLYSKQVISLNDLNFRNFIIIDDQIFGLDFEQIELTNQITQYATLLAYMLLYNPIASNFKVQLLEEIIIMLASNQDINQDQLLTEIAEQLQIINERRTRIKYS